MFLVKTSIFPRQTVIRRNKISRIKLNSRLVTKTLQSPTTFFVINSANHPTSQCLKMWSIVHCLQVELHTKYFAHHVHWQSYFTYQDIDHWSFDREVVCPRVLYQLYYAHSNLTVCVLHSFVLPTRYNAFWCLASQIFAHW